MVVQYMKPVNPFIYSRPLDPGDLINRDEECEELLALAEGGHAVRLSAPRRYGKTSLLRRLGRDAERAGMNYVEVDFYGVLSHLDVAARIEDAYARLNSAPRRVARTAIRTLKPALSVGAGPVRVESRPQLAEGASRLLLGLLDLPAELFERTGTRTLVAFDEFQALLAVDPQIDGLFRSRIQHHGDAASYVFAGSHPGLMEHLFGAHERPFFGQASPVPLAPLADGEIADYVGRRFEKTDRDVGAALDPLLDLAAGHPQRAMLLAHYLWQRTPPGQAASPEIWEETLITVFERHGDALRATWDSLEAKERAVFTALAVGDAALFSERTLARYNLSRGGAQHARETLARAGHLQRVNGDWQPVDPLLALWAAEFPHTHGEGLLR